MGTPRSLKISSLAALLCLPASAVAFFYLYAWLIVWDEDIAKSLMTGTPGYELPFAERAVAYLHSLPGLLLLLIPVACGALMPVLVLVVSLLYRMEPPASFHRPGMLLFLFLVLCAGGLIFTGISSLPAGLALLPLAALTVAAAFLPLIPSSSREPNQVAWLKALASLAHMRARMASFVL